MPASLANCIASMRAIPLPPHILLVSDMSTHPFSLFIRYASLIPLLAAEIASNADDSDTDSSLAPMSSFRVVSVKHVADLASYSPLRPLHKSDSDKKYSAFQSLIDMSKKRVETHRIVLPVRRRIH